MIPQNVIEEILDRVSIVDVIGRAVELKRSGRNYLGLCPFHQEKSPSFSVSADKGLYHCFGCGASGNTLKFLMEQQKLTFLEAIRELGKTAGIDVDQYASNDISGESREKETLLAVNNEAMQYYHKILLESPEAVEARGYLKSRKITLETVKTYRLGFGGKTWQGLADHLKSKGFNDKDAIKAGVISTGNGRNFDRFKDRVVFPILDRDGKPVGFGGRILTNDKKTAKYLNTAENPVFHKGSLLFSLNFAKDEISKNSEAILVEGYMDVIALFQKGVRNAVAPLGTAFTESQLSIIQRFCNTVYFVFDGDSAGISAANRALDTAVGSSLVQWVVILPEGKDPYDFAMESGGDAFRKYMTGKRLAPIDFKLRYFAKKIDIKTQKVKLLAELFPYLLRVKSSVTRDEYLKKTAAFLQEDYTVILAEYNSFQKDSRSVGRVMKSLKGKKEEAFRMEIDFIAHFAIFPEMRDEVTGVVTADMLQHPGARKLYETIVADPSCKTKELLAAVDDDDILRQASELAINESVKPDDLRIWAWTLRLQYLMREMAKMTLTTHDAEADADLEGVKRLHSEKQELAKLQREAKDALKEFGIFD